MLKSLKISSAYDVRIILCTTDNLNSKNGYKDNRKYQRNNYKVSCKIETRYYFIVYIFTIVASSTWTTV